jgi:RNA polymerase sigma factor (TIGR02999 family)
MSEVTRILVAIQTNQPQAASELLPLVYDELRQLAAAKLAQEKPGQTLNATALVHEAYLRLVGDQHFDGRGHFFAAAAEAMRRILIENARRKRSDKHGGGRQRLDLNAAGSLVDEGASINTSALDLLDLDDALNRQAQERIWSRGGESARICSGGTISVGRGAVA